MKASGKVATFALRGLEESIPKAKSLLSKITQSLFGKEKERFEVQRVLSGISLKVLDDLEKIEKDVNIECHKNKSNLS